MIRYIHGSGDSTDLDVVYVFPEMPSFTDCQKFCNADPKENRNIIVVENGTVKSCFKGNPDEVNNAVLRTYPLHQQADPLLILGPVPRDIYLKDIAVTRKVMSPLTASPLRSRMKAALHADWPERIAAMKELRFADIPFDSVKKWHKEDLLKSMAFQLGQGLGLHRGVELYSKGEIAEHFPQLRTCLYRQAEDLQGLQAVCDDYLEILSRIEVRTLPGGYTQFLSTGAVYDIHREKRIPQETYEHP